MNICLLVLFLGLTTDLFAQVDTVSSPLSPSLGSSRSLLKGLSPSVRQALSAALPDSLNAFADSLKSLVDSLEAMDDDTLDFPPDTLDSQLPVIGNSPSALTSIVHYQAQDSIAFDVNRRKAQLYNKGKI